MSAIGQHSVGKMACYALGTCLAAASHAAHELPARCISLARYNSDEQMTVPTPHVGIARQVTIDDVLRIRRVDSLSVSPDGARFAIFVYQADHVSNRYLSHWLVGDIDGKGLVPVGDGGDLVTDEGGVLQTYRKQLWSPDGKWIAYTVLRNGEVQIWVSSVDGRCQQQVTRSLGDIVDFKWSADGRSILFTFGTPRSQLQAIAAERQRRGYRHETEYLEYLAYRTGGAVSEDHEPSNLVQVVSLDDLTVRPASETERSSYRAARGSSASFLSGNPLVVPHSAQQRADGAIAWLERLTPRSTLNRVVARRPQDDTAMTCRAAECVGGISRVSWQADGQTLLFRRRENVGNVDPGWAEVSWYEWSPQTDSIRLKLRLAGELGPYNGNKCELVARDRLLCIRETADRAPHVVVYDLQSGHMRVIAELNAEFLNIRLGRVERIEWDTPHFAWNEPGSRLAQLYPKRAHGYILYPPDFDPRKKYPVFIEPYWASGFEFSLGGEHALHVYAANGFIVLNTQFPGTIDGPGLFGDAFMQEIYSQPLGYPHLSMLAASTFAALDAVSADGFIDERRVGIGGISHATFVPLYMMQTSDRLAAISISSGPPSWGPDSYNLGSPSIWLPPENHIGPSPLSAAGSEFWRNIDINEHISCIEGPVLMHIAAAEWETGTQRLARSLFDAGLPYDAYVFANEGHVKWQPAHLSSIMTRNLDWFRFWLQDFEDPDPAKSEQYQHWRTLRKLQCRNTRSLRDYCSVVSGHVAIAN